MKYVRALNRHYQLPPFILPQPYDLYRWPFCHKRNVARFEAKDLFLQALSIKSNYHASLLWRRLPRKDQLRFENVTPDIHFHLHRIREGYQIAQASDSDENPFYALGLYPWEIVKDKLRNRPAFGSDIYDWLIQEALLCNRRWASPEKVYEGYVAFKDLEPLRFSDLLAIEQQKYKAIAQKKLDFIDHREIIHKNRPASPTNAFDAFAKKHLKGMTGTWQFKLQELGLQWKKMLLEEKKIYGVLKLPVNRRDYREFALEQQTSVVLDYIFTYGEAKNSPGCWRQWRKEIAGDLIYLNKMYSPTIVMLDRDYNILFRDRVPIMNDDLA